MPMESIIRHSSCGDCCLQLLYQFINEQCYLDLQLWPLYEAEEEGEVVPPDTVFESTALQLLRVLLNKARALRKVDTAKAERLARLAERRARDG